MKQRDEDRDRPKKIGSIGKRAWKYFSKSDKLLHDRVNYYLVAESMLLFSFVTAYMLSEQRLIQIRPAIAFTGIAITSTWFYTNRRMRIRMRFFHEMTWKKDNILYDWRKAQKISPTEEFMITTFLPAPIFFLWLYLFAFSMNADLIFFLEVWLPFSIGIYIALFFIFEYFLSP